MTNKINISLILLLVFSFMLVHNIIPHHHYDEISDIDQHKHNHHHDKQEQDHHSENDEPIGFFAHPIHIFASTEFTFKYCQSFQKTQNVNQFFPIDNFVIKPITIPKKQKPPNYISVIPLQLFCTTHSLRGPPVFYV